MFFDQNVIIFLFAILGLVVGSFCNVVIYRLPKMLELAWQNEKENADSSHVHSNHQEAYNLATPRSRCTRCEAPIRWYQNIPLFSYIFLRGMCGNCKNPISIRYPIVEAGASLLFGICAIYWKQPGTALLWSGFCAALLCLALIDWDTTLLPDDITLPLMWFGIVVALLQWTPLSLSNAIWGCIAGYVSLWSIYWVFKLLTGKEGMGYGDFKLLAALGAWLGWESLIPVILVSSILGALVGIGLKALDRLREGIYLPFGPFLALAGILSAFGINRAVFNWLGL